MKKNLNFFVILFLLLGSLFSCSEGTNNIEKETEKDKALTEKEIALRIKESGIIEPTKKSAPQLGPIDIPYNVYKIGLDFQIYQYTGFEFEDIGLTHDGFPERAIRVDGDLWGYPNALGVYRSRIFQWADGWWRIYSDNVFKVLDLATGGVTTNIRGKVSIIYTIINDDGVYKLWRYKNGEFNELGEATLYLNQEGSIEPRVDVFINDKGPNVGRPVFSNDKGELFFLPSDTVVQKIYSGGPVYDISCDHEQNIYILTDYANNGEVVVLRESFNDHTFSEDGWVMIHDHLPYNNQGYPARNLAVDGSVIWASEINIEYGSWLYSSFVPGDGDPPGTEDDWLHEGTALDIGFSVKLLSDEDR